jgi:peptidyl-prolyl cis-trans isomerase C
MTILRRFPAGRRLRLLSLTAAAALALAAAPALAEGQSGDQVLVEVADTPITVSELEQTVASSPFAVQFNTMDQDAQAALRGVLLKRLVASHLLRLEAKAQKIADGEGFKYDVAVFRKGLLFRKFMDELRNSVELPADELEGLKQTYKDTPDALTAAKSAAVTKRYRALKVLALQKMRQDRHVVTHEDRIKQGMAADTVLLEGDGMKITYGDLILGESFSQPPDEAWIRERFYEYAETELIAAAGEVYAPDVKAEVDSYVEERLPAALREQLESQWIAGDDTLRAYYDKHPGLGKIAGRWHVGQLVVDKREVAERLRQAIIAGASLFRIAESYSIDPYGKQHAGDMGWLREGQGAPVIEAAVARLKPGEVSEIIETPKGFHLLTLIEKRDGEKLDFDSLKPKLRQTLSDEMMAGYLAELQKKYDVKWKVLEGQQAQAAKQRG